MPSDAGPPAPAVLHPDLRRAADHHLRLLDRLLPGRLRGFHLVGSSALGAYRPDRSDIDAVAITDRALDRAELRRLRVVHARSTGRSAARALARGRRTLPGVCNVVYVAAEQLTRPVTTIEPVASHTGLEFSTGTGFDVNPAMWKVLLEAGITLRGPAPAGLGLDPEPERLRSWTRENLDAYWRSWAEGAMAGRPPTSHLLPARWHTAWGVLGPPRLHHTVATGGVISKEAAGEYALDVFDAEWHPLVAEALAYWRGQPADARFADTRARHRRTGAFGLMVIDSALALP